MRFFAMVQQFRDTLDPLVDEAALHAIDAIEAWVKANAKDLDCENLYDVIDEYEVGSDPYGGCAEEDCEGDEGMRKRTAAGKASVRMTGKKTEARRKRCAGLRSSALMASRKI